MTILKQNGVWQSNLNSVSNSVYPTTRKREIRYVNGQPVNLFEDEWEEIDKRELYLSKRLGTKLDMKKGD